MAKRLTPKIAIRRMQWRITGLMVLASVLAALILQIGVILLILSQTVNSKEWIEEVKEVVRQQTKEAQQCFPKDGPPDLALLTSIVDRALQPSGIGEGLQLQFLYFTVGSWQAAVMDPSGLVMVASPDWKVFAVGESGLPKLNLRERGLFELALQGRTEIGWSDGRLRVATPMMRDKKVLAVFVARSDVIYSGWKSWQGFLGSIFGAVFVISVATGIVGAVVGQFVARQVSRKLIAIAETAEKWSKGDLSEMADENPADELGLLAAQLNRMAKGLEQVMLLRKEVATLEERHRITRDLHDTVKQEAFATSMMVASAQRFQQLGDEAGVRRALAEAFELSRQMQTDLSQILDQMRSDAKGASLVDEIERITQSWRKRSSIEIRVEGTLSPSIPMDEQVVRIVEEAVANSIKHSEANAIGIGLRSVDGCVTIEIRDDGNGFDSERPSRGLGMTSMTERAAQLSAGKLEIESKLGQGTVVRLQYEQRNEP
jgi:signal transduction histidine kinase